MAEIANQLAVHYQLDRDLLITGVLLHDIGKINIPDEILNKPRTRQNAFSQLQKSSGRTVTFLTSIALLNTETGILQNHVEFFRVVFKSLSENHILSYLEKEDVLNCAGSFKSEGLGIALCDRLEGNDPNSLIGLPTIQLIKMLAKENVHIL